MGMKRDRKGWENIERNGKGSETLKETAMNEMGENRKAGKGTYRKG